MYHARMSQELDLADRASAAYELVMNGMSWSRVVTTLGYGSVAEAKNDFILTINESVSDGNRDFEIQKMTLQLDRLYRAAVQIINSKSAREGDRIKAINTASKILSQKSQLGGFNQPVKHQHLVTRGINEELNDLIKALSESRKNALPQEVDIFEAEVIE